MSLRRYPRRTSQPNGAEHRSAARTGGISPAVATRKEAWWATDETSGRRVTEATALLDGAVALDTGPSVLKNSLEDVVVILGALSYSAVITALIAIFRSHRRKARNLAQDPFEQDYNTW